VIQSQNLILISFLDTKYPREILKFYAM
jgi:hypothetical protein